MLTYFLEKTTGEIEKLVERSGKSFREEMHIERQLDNRSCESEVTKEELVSESERQRKEE